MLKAGFICLNSFAWNNGKRPRSYLSCGTRSRVSLMIFYWFDTDQEVMIIEAVGGISITAREVKFLDRRKTN